MTIKSFAGLTAGALIIAFAIFWLGVTHGLAADCVLASWYGRESGSVTATGAKFDGSQWIVAHKSLPFGTKLRLTYRGKSVVVPVGDRGPYIKGRTLDLSSAVAEALGTKAAGVACVKMERL